MEKAGRMKIKYTYTDGVSFWADADDLKRMLEENRSFLQNYEEVASCLSDDDYVARGNGFCEAKYSEDFVEGQRTKYLQRIKNLEQWIRES